MATEGPKAMITRVVVKNYRSMVDVDVELGPLTFLVGPNGSGKSNFLDALRFLSHALNVSLENAISARMHMGFLSHFRTKTWFSIEVRANLEDGSTCRYFLRLSGPENEPTINVDEEACVCWSPNGSISSEFSIRNGEFDKLPEGLQPKISSDRLAFPLVSAAPHFRPLFDHLAGIRYYDIEPSKIEATSRPSSVSWLMPDGSNAATVMAHLQEDHAERSERLCGYLGNITPGISARTVRSKKKKGEKEEKLYLFFPQEVGADSSGPEWFFADQMSTGTRHAFGILLALLQEPAPSLIVIEEPEATVHPAALHALLEAIRDASSRTQILIATHSADLLEDKDIKDGELRLARYEDGETKISKPGEYSKGVMAKKLYSAGELLRMEQLLPNEERDAADVGAGQ